MLNTGISGKYADVERRVASDGSAVAQAWAEAGITHTCNCDWRPHRTSAQLDSESRFPRLAWSLALGRPADDSRRNC